MICDAYLQLLDLGKPNEIYNVCSGQSRSLQLVLDTLKQITDHNIEIRVNPDFVRAKTAGLAQSEKGSLKCWL